jgi:hypothetical protein
MTCVVANFAHVIDLSTDEQRVKYVGFYRETLQEMRDALPSRETRKEIWTVLFTCRLGVIQCVAPDIMLRDEIL